MRLAVILIALATTGCGVVDVATSAIAGMDVSEAQTESLTCAIVQFGWSVSIDCVERDPNR